MTSRPNFLVIVADQLRADCLPGFASTPVRTPNLDRLAAGGVRFSEAFTQHSVCSPSRVSFITGRYPHVRGHRTLQHLLQPDEANFLQSFKEAGYHVVHAGSRGDTFGAGAAELALHEHGFADPALLDFRDFFANHPPSDEGPLPRAHYLGSREPDVIDFDEAVIRSAERWLQAPPREPWLLYVPLIFPHPPFQVEEPWFSMYPRSGIELPRQARGAQPGFFAELIRRHGWDRLQDRDWQEIRAVYYGMISRLDMHVGRLQQAVARSGGEGELFTAFFSDHGEYLGDYGAVEKWPAGVNECLVRTPLIVAGPDVAQGAKSAALIELIDLFPTLLHLAGISPAHQHYGRSFERCLREPAAEHRLEVFSEGGFRVEEAELFERATFPYDQKAQLQHDRPELVGKVVALRNREWTYVWRLYEPAELYHRPSDPHELVNLAGGSHGDVEQALQQRLLRWLLDTADVIEGPRPARFVEIDLPRPGQWRPAQA
ncbi:Arylsulfatase A [Pseudomonas flavescens]|uniref:Arylsulfatase A n=1 Tax=Phytopseudomonas flavescens TaxID=29435 RepID=A0A1G8G0I7_9GAMM|nr:sulfatase-like hydrolase/transferase [Pseudomonas flavescens]SDH87917.1 Arylsulfatase A [Pseudomonas flavescens]